MRSRSPARRSAIGGPTGTGFATFNPLALVLENVGIGRTEDRSDYAVTITGD